MDIMQCRLTEEEITTTMEAVPNHGVPMTPTEWGLQFDHAVADAATEKALRCVLLWLQEFEDSHNDGGENVISIMRGHGLEMAADELEALLAGKGA